MSPVNFLAGFFVTINNQNGGRMNDKTDQSIAVFGTGMVLAFAGALSLVIAHETLQEAQRIRAQANKSKD